MPERELRVLLVEDDEFDQVNVTRMLQDAGPGTSVEVRDRLGPALERMIEGKLDVVLLDLNLPDSAGSPTVRAAVSRAVGIPVVVLTGHSDARLGMEAVRAGAQDFLSKDGLDPDRLNRVIQHAIERQRLLNDLSRQYAAWTTVVRSLRALDNSEPLQRAQPDRFQELVGVYAQMLVRTTTRLRRSDSHHTTIEEISRRLASARATVSDLLDVHLAAIGRRVESESQFGRTREQEQLLILEIMGHLVAQYRLVALESTGRSPRAL